MKKRKKRSVQKGAVQIDYIIAAGLFLMIFVVFITFATEYFSTTKESVRLMILRGEAIGLLGVAEQGYVPENWTEDSYPSRIGLATTVYRFFILANNTGGGALTDELVQFNYTEIGFEGIDYNSTIVYDDNNTVSYNISRDMVTFKTDIEANEVKWFTVYFDDDSNFTDRSAVISGTDSLSEKIYPVEEISLLQYKKIQLLNASNYTKMKNSSDIENNFRIKIYDIGLNQTFLDYGGDLPAKGDVIALQRYVLYQNKTADIRNGRLTIRVW